MTNFINTLLPLARIPITSRQIWRYSLVLWGDPAGWSPGLENRLDPSDSVRINRPYYIVVVEMNAPDSIPGVSSVGQTGNDGGVLPIGTSLCGKSNEIFKIFNWIINVFRKKVLMPKVTHLGMRRGYLPVHDRAVAG